MKVLSVILFFVLGLEFLYAAEYKEIEKLKKYEIGVILTYRKNNSTPSNIEVIYKKDDMGALANLRTMLFSSNDKNPKLAKSHKEILFRKRKVDGKSIFGLVVSNDQVQLTRVDGTFVMVSLKEFKNFFKGK